jgi:hypothetical protein
VQEKIERDVKRALAYLHNCQTWLWHEGLVSTRWRWFDYGRLLEQAIDTAATIVEHLPDSYFETDDDYNESDDWLAEALKLVAAIEARREADRKRRRIEALENVTGRTPEEAELYRAKADELRRSE